MFEYLKNAGMCPSRLGMGCEPLGGADWGKVDINEARRAVRRALDVGITVFDTADVYGLGRSESELGRALGQERHNAFIITKFGVSWESSQDGSRARTFKDSSLSHLFRALEGSLRRLRLEAIPLYLVHWPDPSVPIAETLGGLEEARRQGKILNYGLSNFGADQVLVAAENYQVVAVEGPYSLIDSLNGKDVFKVARDKGISTFAYGSLGQGLLTGKYTKHSEFGSDDRRFRLPQFSGKRWQGNKLLLEELGTIAKYRGRSITQTAVRWVLDSGLIDTAIVGAKSVEQVDENFGALGWELEDSEVDRLGFASMEADSEANAPGIL